MRPHPSGNTVVATVADGNDWTTPQEDHLPSGLPDLDSIALD
jgi:hypothetical protein